MNGYERTIKLQNDEIPAKVNVETGEITELHKSWKSAKPGREIFNKNAKFKKSYEIVHRFLLKRLTLQEYKVVGMMIDRAKPGTNSLIPLDDNTSMTSLGETFGVDRKKIKGILSKLFSLGVYAKFEIAEENDPDRKYWILNPYISFRGREIDSDINKLFANTIITRHFVQQQELSKYN